MFVHTSASVFVRTRALNAWPRVRLGAPEGEGPEDDSEEGPHYRSAGAPPLLSVSSLRRDDLFHTHSPSPSTHTLPHMDRRRGQLRALGQDLEISGDLAEKGKRGNREKKLERSDWRGYRGTEGLKHGRALS